MLSRRHTTLLLVAAAGAAGFVLWRRWQREALFAQMTPATAYELDLARSVELELLAEELE